MGRTEAHGQLTAVSILEAFNVASRATSIGFAGGAEHGLVYNDFLQLFFSRSSELDLGGVHTRAMPVSLYELPGSIFCTNRKPLGLHAMVPSAS